MRDCQGRGDSARRQSGTLYSGAVGASPQRLLPLVLLSGQSDVVWKSTGVVPEALLISDGVGIDQAFGVSRSISVEVGEATITGSASPFRWVV